MDSKEKNNTARYQLRLAFRTAPPTLVPHLQLCTTPSPTIFEIYVDVSESFKFVESPGDEVYVKIMTGGYPRNTGVLTRCLRGRIVVSINHEIALSLHSRITRISFATILRMGGIKLIINFGNQHRKPVSVRGKEIYFQCVAYLNIHT